MNIEGDSSALTPLKEPLHLEENKSTTKKYMRIPDRIINLKAVNKIKINRGRMVSWLFEVFSIYQLGWECFWLCAELLEDLVISYDYVNLNNLHLVGITCIFMCKCDWCATADSAPHACDQVSDTSRTYVWQVPVSSVTIKLFGQLMFVIKLLLASVL